MTVVRNKTSRGYSLIEMLIAIAILGMVLLSVVTLFILGRRTVYSGKQMSQAIAVATRVQEDLRPMTRDQMYEHFNLKVSGFSSPVLFGTTYTNSVVRTTVEAGGANDPQKYLENWAKLIPTSKFTNAKITLVFTPTEAAVAPSAEPANPNTSTSPTSTVLKVRTIVEWWEGGRNRNVMMDTVKTARRIAP